MNWDPLSQLLRRGEEGRKVKRTGRTEKKAWNCPCDKNLVPEDQLKYSNWYDSAINLLVLRTSTVWLPRALS